MKNGSGRRALAAAAQPASDKVIRCAIYTRKSTEEGLQQDFSSLDAQREAGEARLGFVTRARLTQIMNLLLLAPDIQERILGLDLVAEQKIAAARRLRKVVKNVFWEHQRRDWARTE